MNLVAEVNHLLATMAAAQVAAPKPRPTKECRECEGHGQFADVCGEDTSGMGGISPIYRYTRCDECRGTGRVEHDDLCDCDECFVDEDE